MQYIEVKYKEYKECIQGIYRMYDIAFNTYVYIPIAAHKFNVTEGYIFFFN